MKLGIIPSSPIATAQLHAAGPENGAHISVDPASQAENAVHALPHLGIEVDMSTIPSAGFARISFEASLGTSFTEGLV